MTPPTPTHTHLWDGSRDLPDWLTNHRWTAGQLVIRTPDGDTRPQAGWWLIRWDDDLVTTASPAVAERVYGTDGLWGRIQQAEEQLALTLAEKKQCSAQQWPQRLGEAEKALARVHHTADLIAAGAPWTANRDDLAQRIRDAATVDQHAAPDGTSVIGPPPGVSGDEARQMRDDLLTATRPAAWTPPPPDSTAEQLPDDLLDLIRGGMPDYTSTACVTAYALAVAVHWSHPRRAELGQWAERMHARCRRNQKFTGQLCVCGCH